jgi:hypothetical protein
MENHLRLVEREPRIYLVYLKEGGHISVKAESYTDTDYGWFAFYKEDIETVNKMYMKGSPPTPIYELPRREVSSVAEEGVIEMHLKERKVTIKKKKPAIKKTKSKDISQDKQIIAQD